MATSATSCRSRLPQSCRVPIAIAPARHATRDLSACGNKASFDKVTLKSRCDLPKAGLAVWRYSLKVLGCWIWSKSYRTIGIAKLFSGFDAANRRLWRVVYSAWRGGGVVVFSVFFRRNVAGAPSLYGGVPENIIRRQIRHFSKADPAYGQGVAKELDLKF
jgi:hypothetical protein